MSAQLPRWLALGVVVFGAVALSGCASEHGSLASQVRAWASTAGYVSDAAQVESDLTDLANGQREHQLLDLRTACEGFGADVYAIYGELPTPDTTITDELGNAMQTFYSAARNCYDASSFTSSDFKTYERQLASAKSEFAEARSRLARDGIG